MKIEKEYLDNHQVKITAEFDASVMEGFMRRAARALSKDHKIPGFRPGKAPYEVVKRYFGEDAIEKQAVDLMLDELYPKVIDQAEVQPSGPGSLDKIESINPPKFVFSIPLMPEVELGDYRSIRIDYQLEPVTDEDVQKVMENLRESYATAAPVERPAQERDLVAFKIKGSLTQPAEGEESEIVKEFSNQLLLAEDEEQTSWPFKGFWKELVGLSAGDTKTIVHQFPEDTSFSRFQNKEIEFAVEVENVKEMQYPELDDAFVKTLGDYETLDDLRTAIRDNLEKTRKEEYDQKYVSMVIDQALESSTIKYSQNTLQQEIEHVLSTVQQDLAKQNLDLETYLKFKNTDQETFLEEEIKPIAVRRMERSLMLDSIARAEGIQISEDEMRVGVTQTISQLFGMPEFKKPSTSRDMQKLTEVVSFDTATRILNQKVQDRLVRLAKGETPTTETPADTSSEEGKEEHVEAPEQPVAATPESAPTIDAEQAPAPEKDNEEESGAG